MANYTTDEDLAVYYARVDLLGATAQRHTQATAEIDRRLRVKGYDDDDLAGLSDQTKSDLKAAACYFVLSLSFQALDNPDRAEAFQKLAVEAFSSTKITVDGDGGNAAGTTDLWSDDEVRLG
jgi:hypothetical protein